MKTNTINARIEPHLKADAEAILKKLGLTSAEAIRLFYSQICLHEGLPFEVKIPNAETLAAIRDAEEGNTLKADSVDALFDELH